MKLYGFVVLLILVLTTGARYEEDDNKFHKEMDTVRRNVHKDFNFNKRLLWQNRDSELPSILSPESKRDIPMQNVQPAASTPSLIQDPVRISVFNDGDYKAHLKLNYIIDNRQNEQQITSPIVPGEERTLFLSHEAVHIRIRVFVIGFGKDQTVIDEQIPDFNNIQEKCYLLAGSNSIPVYGICPMPYSEYFKLWKGKH